MFVYLIVNNFSNNVYVGITRVSLRRRFSSHKSAATRGHRNSKLYDAMRAYGVNNFSIHLLKVCASEEELLQAEKEYVARYRTLLGSTYNILDGGEPYFPITDKEAWRLKLKKARVGKTPAKGMKHTQQNKQLFSQVSRKYWDSQSTYNKHEVTKLSFREATQMYGISKTHYYRLKRSINGQGLTNPVEQSQTEWDNQSTSDSVVGRA